MCHNTRWAEAVISYKQNRLKRKRLTSLSAPSMHTYFAFFSGFARSMMSFKTTPVNSAVERPAAPQEKPLLFLTTFCSFRLFPAHTKVIGYVTFSYSLSSVRRVILNGLATSLRTLAQYCNTTTDFAYPSTENSQSIHSSSCTSGTAPWFLT